MADSGVRPPTVRSVVRWILGTLIVLGFFVVFAFLIFFSDDPQNRGLMIGAMIAAFSTVVGYYFGASDSGG